MIWQKKDLLLFNDNILSLNSLKLYSLYYKQLLFAPRQVVWDFIRDPKNLAVITPAKMNFRTISGDDRLMYPGQIIHYKVSPFSWLTVQWVTEITHVEHGAYFVDEQRFGPYALWHHKHFLREVDGGVEMEDIVHYVMPYGLLGRIVHRMFVKKELNRIFTFRRAKMTELFGSVKA